jgi:serine/threonine protein kinase
MAVAQPIPFGNYLLLERIGVGGTAEVFRAVRRGRRPGEPEVALKRLLPSIAQDESLAALLLREIGALRRIDHPNVVRLLDHGQESGLPFLVMPLLDGACLRRFPDIRLPPALALHVAAETAAGLHAAHAVGVVHRDVSPTNIQITASGSVQLLDFGIARVAGLAQTTHGRGLRGKWPYLSPEQIAGGVLDGRSDLFALGSVLVEMLCGQPPFRADDREQTLALIQAAQWHGFSVGDLGDMPPEWVQALASLLHGLFGCTPDERPGTAAEVAGLLGHLRDQVAAAVPSALPPEVVTGSPVALRCLVALGECADRVPSLRFDRHYDAAELRGEEVTDPALDPDVTMTRGV